MKTTRRAANEQKLTNQRKRWNLLNVFKISPLIYDIQQDETNHRNYDSKSEDDFYESRSDAELRDKQIKVLQETIRNLQRKLIETNTKEKQNEAKISELEESIRESNVKELLLRTKIANARTISQSVTNDDASETSSIAPQIVLESESNDPQIISLATAFLVIHPQGASLNSLLVYIQQFVATISEGELLEVLMKNEKLFAANEVDNVQLWFYNGFKMMP